MKEDILKVFEDYDVDKVIHVNHSEYYVVLKWHQKSDDLFEKLAELSAKHNMSVTLYNAGDFINLHFQEVQ